MQKSRNRDGLEQHMTPEEYQLFSDTVVDVANKLTAVINDAQQQIEALKGWSGPASVDAVAAFINYFHDSLPAPGQLALSLSLLRAIGAEPVKIEDDSAIDALKAMLHADPEETRH